MSISLGGPSIVMSILRNNQKLILALCPESVSNITDLMRRSHLNTGHCTLILCKCFYFYTLNNSRSQNVKCYF